MDFIAACTVLNCKVTTVKIFAGDVKWAGPKLQFFLNERDLIEKQGKHTGNDLSST